jgi:hypothetical protein
MYYGLIGASGCFVCWRSLGEEMHLPSSQRIRHRMSSSCAVSPASYLHATLLERLGALFSVKGGYTDTITPIWEVGVVHI